MLKVYTAQYRYSGPDRLDITVKGQDPMGKMFAPTWDMVMGLKDGKIDWLEYCELYSDLMLASYRKNQDQWDSLMGSDQTITFVCFCANVKACHRGLLAEILKIMGWAEYLGEREL